MIEMQTTMKSFLVISLLVAAVLATTVVSVAQETETASHHRNDARHERQRRNRKRHNNQKTAGELNAAIPDQRKHQRNHTHEIKSSTEEVVLPGVIEKMNHRNHTHHKGMNETDDSESRTKNITRAESNKVKREKKAKALKKEMTKDVNTTAIFPLDAVNSTSTEIHVHHKHEGKNNRKHDATKDIDSLSDETSAVASNVTTQNATATAVTNASDAASFATKIVPPSSLTRSGGEGVADPEQPWKEDNELEDILAAVEADFASKKQIEVLMGQQMTNSAKSFTIGITCVACVVGMFSPTILSQLIV